MLLTFNEFSKFFHWWTLENFNKTIVNYFTTPKHVSTLPCKSMCAKIAPTKAQHWQTKRT